MERRMVTALRSCPDHFATLAFNNEIEERKKNHCMYLLIAKLIFAISRHPKNVAGPILCVWIMGISVYACNMQNGKAINNIYKCLLSHLCRIILLLSLLPAGGAIYYRTQWSDRWNLSLTRKRGISDGWQMLVIFVLANRLWNAGELCISHRSEIRNLNHCFPYHKYQHKREEKINSFREIKTNTANMTFRIAYHTIECSYPQC